MPSNATFGIINPHWYQAITWTSVDLPSKVFCGIHLSKVSQVLTNLIYHWFRLLKLRLHLSMVNVLTHWGGLTHICISNLTITGSDIPALVQIMAWRQHATSHYLNQQAIIWTNAGILSIETLGTNFSEISIEILTFSFKNVRLKVSSGKWRPICLGPNVLSGNIPEVAQWNPQPPKSESLSE